MVYKKPFHRTYRPVTKSESNYWYSSWAYITDREYSQNPEHYVRWFLLIQEDLKKLFEFIEPSDINLKTYSFRIYELFMRVCIEIEANFKAILRENNFTPFYQNWERNGQPRDESKWKLSDYKKVNKTHFLSGYSVEFPVWNWERKIFSPYKEWGIQDKLSWYDAYNNCKHDRYQKFAEANFENLLWAISWLLVLLTSQFRDVSFQPWVETLATNSGGQYYDWEFGIWDYFIIDFPDFPEEIVYNFNWSELKKEGSRFDKIDYNNI